MKFLVPIYSCLQNPGLLPPDPRSLCPLSSTEFVDPAPPNKIPGYATALRSVTSQQRAFFITSEYGHSSSCCTVELACPQQYVYILCFLHMNTVCVCLKQNKINHNTFIVSKYQYLHKFSTCVNSNKRHPQAKQHKNVHKGTGLRPNITMLGEICQALDMASFL